MTLWVKRSRSGRLPASATSARFAFVGATLVFVWTTGAFGQGQLPDVAPLGGAPQPGQQGQQGEPPPEDQPETHAAPGGTDSTLPEGDEPTLPEDPLEMSEQTREHIGTDGDPEARGTGDEADRSFYGLYYSEEAGEYRYRVAFPIWAERTKPSETDPTITDRASLYGGLYYNRRSASHRDDILFPVAWNLQNPLEKSRTTVVGPFVNRRAPGESDDWLLPLYATGTRKAGGYTLIPPLLTSLKSDEDGGFNLVGPAYCSWTGGQQCDTRTAQDIDLGVAPLYFFGQNRHSLYEIVTPLLHYYHYDARYRTWLNIYGPSFRQHKVDRDLFHLIPFYWSIWGEDERHTTVAPLFHYGHKGEKENLLITPLFLNKNSEEGANTFVTWGYARHRGATELDMVSPLFWHHRDPRIGLDRKLLLPFLYTNTSPREEHSVFFPFWSHRDRYGISESTWVTPAFNYTTHQRGWSLALNPILYLGKDGHSSHTVVAPVFFDFANARRRTTVGLPFFARVNTLDTTHQVIGNTYYSERRYKNGTDWEFHVLPFFSYGQSPRGHFWNVLFGLSGYTRDGTSSEIRALWIPIELSK